MIKTKKLDKSYYSKDGELLEKGIQRQICDWLNEKGLFFWRSNNNPIFARSGDGHNRFRALPKYTPRGLPDIIVILDGKFIAIEVKRPNSKLRPEQAEFAAKLVLNGGVYHVIHSLDEIIPVFQSVTNISPLHKENTQ